MTVVIFIQLLYLHEERVYLEQDLRTEWMDGWMDTVHCVSCLFVFHSYMFSTHQQMQLSACFLCIFLSIIVFGFVNFVFCQHQLLVNVLHK